MFLKVIFWVEVMTLRGEYRRSCEVTHAICSMKARFARNKERKEEKKIDRIRFVLSLYEVLMPICIGNCMRENKRGKGTLCPSWGSTFLKVDVRWHSSSHHHRTN